MSTPVASAAVVVFVLLSAVWLQQSRVRPFANGSFEDLYEGWTTSGAQRIAANDPLHPASNGSRAVVFDNPENARSHAVLEQTFAIIKGQRYGLTFDLGAVGATADQVVRVTVRGAEQLFERELVVASADGSPSYTTGHVSFVADANFATVSFADVSSTYWYIDALLDNVRLTTEQMGAPLIESEPEAIAVAIGGQATFTVKAGGSGPMSYQWRLNGRDIPGATESSYTVRSVRQRDGGHYTVRVANAAGAIVSSMARLTVLPTDILLNGSFEYGTAGWTFSDSRSVAVSTNVNYGVTHGKQLVHFNFAQQKPGETVTQTFATVPGREYVLTCDVGAVSRVNRDEQQMEITLTGGAPLASETVAVSPPGNGWHYVSRRLGFVADGVATTVTFRDASRTTDNVDLLLDNVRVEQLASSKVKAGSRRGR